MSKSLKAYEVTDGDEGWCIVFATNNATARREGANEINSDWESIESCRRVQEFDQYAPGPVPIQAKIDHGWWFECYECERRISSELAQDVVDEGLNSDDFKIVTRGQQVFCCDACMAEYDRKKEANKAAKDELRAIVEAKYPGCEIKHVHVYGESLRPTEKGHGVNAKCDFKFPGAKYGASYIYGDAHCYVSPDDVELFTKLYRKPDAEQTSLGKQVATAQAEMATWTPERNANCRLEGSTPSTPVDTTKEQ